MRLIKRERKSQVLTKPQFGCLSQVYSVNVTRGCEFRCVYCYARGYPGAPKDEVLLYYNLPEKLVDELDNPRRKKIVTKVAFNTASDSFQTHPDILNVSYDSMKVLLERGISISFLTKGWIPDRFLRLFEKYKAQVSASIGIVSTSNKYWRLFEPGAASPMDRMNNIIRLKEVGIEPYVRIDPIIPFYTDDELSVKELFERLSRNSIQKVTLSYLHLRPAILDQLRTELPETEFKVLEACFETQKWANVGTSTKSKLIPLSLRKRGYQRFFRIAKDYGIDCLICSCKNPDMPAHKCLSGSPTTLKKPPKYPAQLGLFQC